MPPGLGPIGAASYGWDAARQRNDNCVAGALANLTALISAFNPVLWGGQYFTGVSMAARVLIVVGAVLGPVDLFRGKRSA